MPRDEMDCPEPERSERDPDRERDDARDRAMDRAYEAARKAQCPHCRVLLDNTGVSESEDGTRCAGCGGMLSAKVP